MTRNPLRRASTSVAVASLLALVVLSAGPAWSHSELTRSDPPNGGMVPAGRTFLTLWFAEPVGLEASAFRLSTQEGRRVPVTASVTGRSTVVRLDTGPLARTGYELEWRVLSLDDGHPSQGSLAFGAGTRPDPMPTRGGAMPPVALLLLRWLDVGALLLVVGALAVAGRVLGSLGEAGRRAGRTVRRTGAVAALVAVAAGLLTPFVRTLRPGAAAPGSWVRDTVTTVAHSPWGHVWLLRELALVVVAAAMASWARPVRTSSRRSMTTAAWAVSVVAVLEAWAGHASDLTREPVPAAAASALHLLAAGIWAGGLVLLTATLVPLMRRQPDLRGPVLASVWRTFSPRAALASGVLVATGLYEAGRHLPDLTVLGATVYGGAVAAKLLLVLAALALAGLHTLLVHPGLAGAVGSRIGRPQGWSPLSLRRFATTVTVEAAVLVAAVAAAALAISVPTARQVTQADVPTAPRSANVDGLFVSFEEVPSGPGRARVVVRVRSTVLPEPAPVSDVDVVLSGPGTPSRSLPLARVESGRYEAGVRAPAQGRWAATVTVRRNGLADALARVRWRVDTTEAIGPLEVTTTALAAFMLVGGLAALRRVAVRRRHAGDPAPNRLGQTEESRR